MFSTSHFHPMLVHFPVALILAGYLAEIAYLVSKKDHFLLAGFWLLILGAISAAVAYLTGHLFTGEMTGPAGEIKSHHEFFATFTLVLVMVNALFNIYLKTMGKEKPAFQWLTFGLYTLSAITVAITGYYGGILVYSYMMPL